MKILKGFLYFSFVSLLFQYAAVAWYEVSWLPHPQHPPDTLYEDYQHTYYLHPDGHSITAFISGR